MKLILRRHAEDSYAPRTYNFIDPGADMGIYYSPMNNIKAGFGLSLKRDYLQATRDAFQQAQKNMEKETADLAIVISSPEFAHSGTLSALKNFLGPATALIGASSRAVISNYGISKQSLGVLLLKLPQGAYCNAACIQKIKDREPHEAGEELGEKLLRGFKGIRKDFGLILSDMAPKENSGLIAGLQERLGLSFPLIGASLLDELNLFRPSIYFEQQPLKDSAAAIIIGGKLNFGVGVKHGWRPLGKPRLVTKSENNVVYEINGASATNLYEEYFNCDLAKLKKELARISVFYPVGIHVKEAQEYLLRSVASIEDNGSLCFQGNIPEGSTIRLMIATKDSCLEATKYATREANSYLGGANAKLVLVFNSFSRYKLLGDDSAKDIDIIKGEFGENTPVIGLLSCGEQAPLASIDYRGKAYFLNHSILVLVIGD
ncbi:MAG: FIST C-terminal domain-containing protein [Candidatus Omnitrophica bacterium]|nr:FIST C-terminal domain-containing protein [Candidatus Omnitrophota bacterium]